jgi:hypothetical protein
MGKNARVEIGQLTLGFVSVQNVLNQNLRHYTRTTPRLPWQYFDTTRLLTSPLALRGSSADGLPILSVQTGENQRRRVYWPCGLRHDREVVCETIVLDCLHGQKRSSLLSLR